MRNYLTIAGLLATLLPACIYDADQRCAPGEVLDQDERCICAANHVPVLRDITVIVAADPTAAKPREGCEACGENELAQGNTCVCVEGFVRNGEACVASNLGAACAADADCANGDNTKCRLPEGYCTTSGCAANDDCNVAADFACDRNEAEAYCRRPPVGQGNACTSMGFDPSCPADAPICALGACAPAGCTGDAECSPSRRCCDLSAFVGQPLTLCMGGCP
jgi:hypothetical protein